MTASLLEQFCEMENGALRSIDLSKLYQACEAEQAKPRVRLAVARSTPSEAVAWLQRLFVPPGSQSTALVRRQHVGLARYSSTSLDVATKQQPLDLSFQPLETRSYSVETSNDSRDGDGNGGNGGGRKTGQMEIELPFGMPRFVNARTLKAMFGGRPWDRLFRKSGNAWIVCPDSFRIDVRDGTQLFRLGKIQIAS